jgi:S-adenosylmethionine:tRNA ribosyltransferase-isomerase
MLTADFDYVLPPELIAQTPEPQRDQSRLLVLDRTTGQLAHRKFRDVLECFRPGDVLVLNNSRVIPARLRGVNAKTGGAFEIFLLEENSRNDWWTLMKPGKRARVGTQIRIVSRSSRGHEAHTEKQSEPPHVGCYNIHATVMEANAEGHRRLQFSGTENIYNELDALGEIPLPPYIRRDAGTPSTASACSGESPKLAGSETGAPTTDDRERYQTIYAQPPGSVAAPTAGLHFTEALLQELRGRGVQICFVTLHVGLGTFAPVKADTLAAHTMHEERYELSAETARAINDAKREGRRVIAVGTTCVRVLESVAAKHSGELVATSDRTRIFIHPPFRFKIVDVLLTNFHLPCSTLLMLVSAFAAPGETRGREMVLAAYAEAVRERYRFFSYGDAMLIL